VAERLEQSGHQLAPGQIAGATKHDEIKAHKTGVRLRVTKN
jgi:hypothetical protein